MLVTFPVLPDGRIDIIKFMKVPNSIKVTKVHLFSNANQGEQTTDVRLVKCIFCTNYVEEYMNSEPAATFIERLRESHMLCMCTNSRPVDCGR